MDSKASELLAGIQGLCRTIRDELGIYVTYTEHLHEGANEVVITINATETFGSPTLGSVEAVRDELVARVVKMREAA